MKRRLILLSLSVLLLLLLSACTCRHEWKAATCTSPEICTRCHKMNGTVLGHLLRDATCEEAAVCDRCGETFEEAAGHSWAEADCREPKTCTVCGETEGSPRGHIWQDASCTEPKLCSVCGFASGSAAGHQPGDWTYVDSSVTEATLDMAKYCTVCDALLEEQHVELETLHEDDVFLMYPDEMILRLNYMFEQHDHPYTANLEEDEDGELSVVVENSSGEFCCRGWFETPDNKLVKPSGESSADVSSLLFYFEDMEKDTLQDLYIVMVCAARTLDPVISVDEAENVALEASERFQDEEMYTYNDISYLLKSVEEDGAIVLYITLLY